MEQRKAGLIQSNLVTKKRGITDQPAENVIMASENFFLVYCHGWPTILIIILSSLCLSLIAEEVYVIELIALY